ncbi:UDP-glycosyltransferase 89B2-like [Euphorbia lathyris]|uniref:UDP-glycosyltransferase 89B2-like n=1 Tax=Euphorbia lathyris TaxID=212925 RepID=UPI0033130FD3
MRAEIFVVTGHGHGHLHPCMQLCNHLTKRNLQITLIISSTLSPSIPSSFTQNPSISVAPISPPPPPKPGSDFLASQSAQDLHHHLLNRFNTPSSLPHPVYAVVDFQMGWTKHVFWKLEIPVISLFTFGAAAAAMEWGAWKVNAGEIGEGESRMIPGLPEVMVIRDLDLRRKTSGGRGPPKPGDRPPWVPQIEGAVGLMFNTCDDLESVFIRYMEDQLGLPAWGVGPLLPERYWQPETRQDQPESEVMTWLDSKQPKTVLYIAFGSEVTPTMEEFEQLATALEQSTRPFIWVVQSETGYSPNGLDKKVGERGLIINGWAPQVAILSHSSIGGFLSHCGWNSTMEAIGVGVPILGWPIRGDQYFNAKLVVDYLNLGYKVADDMSKIVSKDEILMGIEKLMEDEEMHSKAILMKAKLKDCGFPASSEAALYDFGEFVISGSRK